MTVRFNKGQDFRFFAFRGSGNCGSFFYSDISVRKHDFEGISSYFNFRFSFVSVICFHDFRHSGSVGFDQLQTVKNRRQLGIPTYGESEHNVLKRNAVRQASDRYKFDSVIIYADERAGTKRIISMNNRIQQGFAQRLFRIITAVITIQAFKACRCPIPHIQIGIHFIHLPE